MVKLHDGSHKKLSGDKLSARSEFQSTKRILVEEHMASRLEMLLSIYVEVGMVIL
jgi:hypothetical protein